MGKKTQQQTQTQTTSGTTTADPWAPLQPYLLDLFSRGQNAVNRMPTGPNQTQLTAMDWLRSAIPSTAIGGQELRDLGQATARGDFLRPESNPFLQGAIEAAQRPLRQQLEQNILSIGDAASRAGAYGGDADTLLRGQALRDFNTAALDVANQAYMANYMNERNLQQNAPGLLQAANALMLQPGMLLGELGDQEFRWASELPWLGLDRLAQLLSLGSGYGTQTTSGTSTGTVTAPAGSTGGSIFSGALGGASAGSAFGPWGATIGGILGGLGGLFG